MDMQSWASNLLNPLLLSIALSFTSLPDICHAESGPSFVTLRVGIYHNPPLVSVGPRGKPEGFFVRNLEHIAAQEHWQLRYVDGNWSEQLSRLKDGRLDLLLAVAVSPQRSLDFLFNDETVIVNWAQIFIPVDSPIRSVPDLDGRRIAVLNGDIYLDGDNGLKGICRSFSIDCQLQTYPSYQQVLRSVDRGQADAGLVNRLFGVTEGPNYASVPSPIVLMPTDIRIAFSRKHPLAAQVKARIDKHLRQMKNDNFSFYHQQLRSLFDPAREETTRSYWHYEAIAIGLLLVSSLIGLVYTLKWRIRRQTQALARSEARYRVFFDGVAISLWEGDSSQVLERLQQLAARGVTEIGTHLDSHPELLQTWFRLIRIVNANPTTLKLFRTDTLTELQSWMPHAMTPSAYQTFRQALLEVSQGKSIFTGEMDLLTRDHQPIRVLLSFPISRTLEEARRVPVSMLDITHLRQTERQLSQVIQGASLGFWDWDLINDRLIVNDRWMEMLGLEPGALQQHITDWTGRIHPDDEALILPVIKEHFKQGTSYTLEFRMRHADDHWVWIESAGGVVEYDPITNQPTRASGTHQDITERKHAEETLHTLMRSMVGITGEDFFQRVARELCRWFNADGANIGELVDGNRILALATLIDGKPVENFQYRLKGTPCNQVLNQGACLYPQGVQDLFPADEDLILLNIEGYAGTPIRDMNGTIIGIVWVVSRRSLRMEPDWQDVMEIIAARISAEIERKRAMQQLEHRASFDALTDLPNRRLLLDRLTQSQARCRRHGYKGAVLYMDLDHFKTINDSLGHSVGDILLKEVAERLSAQIRDEDTASRLGGDEFVALFSELDADPQVAAQQARQGAKKIQSALSKPYTIQGNELHITPSIGIVVFPMDEENADDILKYADRAMYRAKDEGRNTIRFFLPGMQQSAEKRIRLQADLRGAITNHELTLYFQPLVDEQARIVGAESLLRWSQPEKGTVEPADFLPVAEESGLILDICDWVLRESMTLCRDWLPLSADFRGVSVNVSSAHFHQAGFTEQVEQSLREIGIDPCHLTLELHEETLAANLEEAIAKISTLRRLGVRFCIDNFGTDAASIVHLRRFHLDEIKIPRHFVGCLPSDTEDARLVQIIFTLGTQMEIDVVAVGVETERQLQLLREMGCRTFQGYYFGKPQPAEQFAARLRDET
jgi:diguanylate cyclase (GGDEF)-like protein/PAS domain S-box-containing protein